MKTAKEIADYLLEIDKLIYGDDEIPDHIFAGGNVGLILQADAIENGAKLIADAIVNNEKMKLMDHVKDIETTASNHYKRGIRDSIAIVRDYECDEIKAQLEVKTAMVSIEIRMDRLRNGEVI